MAPVDPLCERYQSLWDSSLPAIRSGRVELDPILASGKPDARRGLTLLARPGTEVIKEITDFLHQLRAIEPEQYYYTAAQLHFTILSPFTATKEPERFSKSLNSYDEAISAALAGMPRFEIEFSGVTASTGAVMVQGFPRTGDLESLRERLRSELQNRGLTEGLDTRYRLITAHITVMRFRQALRDSEKLADTLESFRDHPFGTSQVRDFELVKNDWYMSPESVELVAHYPLRRS